MFKFNLPEYVRVYTQARLGGEATYSMKILYDTVKPSDFRF